MYEVLVNNLQNWLHVNTELVKIDNFRKGCTLMVISIIKIIGYLIV